VEERQLGTSGIAVSRVVLGCGNFGGIGSAPAFFGQGESREEAFALMDAAWELGITTFDTADAYGGGSSETWIGEWLRDRGPEVRDRAVLSTKVFHSVEGDPADHGLAPARVRRQLEESLRRLGVERVDMYLTHEPDPDTPLEETLATMEDLVAAGKVRAIGASNVDGALLRRGLGTYRWVQNSYSLLDRDAEREVVPLCREHGLGFTPFGPLAGGWLTGKYRRGEEPAPGSRMATRPEPYLELRNERVYSGLEELERRAASRGVDAATLAFAWLVAQPAVTAVVVGPRRPEHLEPAVRALELDLDEAEAAELAALFAPEPVNGS
jgi:aryl-alcohol dehydrogenase-like predicted oxidoreductase